jgi:hypothetical protein
VINHFIAVPWEAQSQAPDAKPSALKSCAIEAAAQG